MSQRRADGIRAEALQDIVRGRKSLGTIGSLVLRKSPVAPPLPRGKEYHVFIINHDGPRDREWSRELVKELESEKYRYKCCISDRNYTAGETVAHNISTCISKSCRVILLLSYEHLKNEWIQLESKVLQEPNRTVKFVPVVIDGCAVPQSLSELAHVDARQDKRKWWKKLINAIRGDAPNLPEGKKDHVFIAHGKSPQDLEWTRETVGLLESAEYGLRCTTRARDFVPGKKKDDNIKRCIDDAFVTIVVLSQSFVLDEWQRYRPRLMDPEVKMVPVLVEDVVMPRDLSDIECLDATGELHFWRSQLLELLVFSGNMDFDITLHPRDSFVTKEPRMMEQKPKHHGHFADIHEDDHRVTAVYRKKDYGNAPRQTIVADVHKAYNEQGTPLEAIEAPINESTRWEDVQSAANHNQNQFLSNYTPKILVQSTTHEDVTFVVKENGAYGAQTQTTLGDTPRTKRNYNVTVCKKLPTSSERKNSSSCCGSGENDPPIVKCVAFFDTGELVLVEINSKDQTWLKISSNGGKSCENILLQSEPISLCCFQRFLFINYGTKLERLQLSDPHRRSVISCRLSSCYSLAVLNAHTMVAADESQVKVISTDGALLSETIIRDTRTKATLSIRSLCLCQNGNLVVAASAANKVFCYEPSSSDSFRSESKWELDVKKPSCVDTDREDNIFIMLDSPGAWSVLIVDGAGQVLKNVALSVYGISCPGQMSCGPEYQLALTHGEWLQTNIVTILKFT